MYNIVIFYFCVAVLWGENGISWIDIYNLLKMSEANRPVHESKRVLWICLFSLLKGNQQTEEKWIRNQFTFSMENNV